MLNYIELELRKNRLLFIAMALTFLISLPCAALISLINNSSVARGFDAALLFWNTGLPILAMLFGALSGAQMRSEQVQEAEAPLPLSPRKKAGGAILAAGIHVLLLAFLVLFVSFLLSSAWRESLIEKTNFGWRNYDWQTDAGLLWGQLFTLTVFAVVYTLLASFICAYGIGHGVLGGFLGLILGLLAIVTLPLGFKLQAKFAFRAPFTGWAYLAMVTALCGAAMALDCTTVWVARRLQWSWTKLWAILFSLIVGSLTAMGALVWTHHRLAHSLQLYEHLSWGESWVGPYPYIPEIKPAPNGALLKSLKGDLVWITPEGHRTILIPGVPADWMGTQPTPASLPYHSAAWDLDGSLWIIRIQRNRSLWSERELWHGMPGKHFTLHMRLPERFCSTELVRRGPELGILADEGFDDKNKSFKYMYASIPTSSQKFMWAPLHQKDVRALRSGSIKGQLTQHRNWRVMIEKLPDGKIQYRVRIGQLGFPLRTTLRRIELHDPLRRQNKEWGQPCWEGAICQWNRTVLDIWNPAAETSVNLEPILKQIRGKAPSKLRPYVLRLSESKLWLLIEGRVLVEADIQTGQPLKQTDLPDVSRLLGKEEFIHVSEEGLFLHTGRRLHFIHWDGSRRDLGPA